MNAVEGFLLDYFPILLWAMCIGCGFLVTVWMASCFGLISLTGR